MKTQTKWFFITLIGLLILSKLAFALPSAPAINYVSNSSAAAGLSNRSTDTKGTITVVTLSANQQDYRWKAYVGNVTGKVALDDVNGQSIYDWDLGVGTGGEVYVSRFSNINWDSIDCVNASTIDSEQTGLSMPLNSKDNINSTFNETTHRSFNVGTIPISGCRSTATYINDTAQTMGPAAYFQEILLRDTVTSNLLYATLMETAQLGFDEETHDFQLLVAENESSTVPSTYFFWVELG
ncbi:MAG: hypothetical protein ACP5N1_04080 [Candidatus Woesearchaeota archaeon]